MKKILFTSQLLALLFISVCGFSQSELAPVGNKFQIGIVASPEWDVPHRFSSEHEMSFLLFNDYYENTLGYTAGMVFQWNTSDHFSLSSGLTFKQRVVSIKGFSLDFLDGSPNDPVSIDALVTTSYVALPLGVKFYFPAGRWRIFINPSLITEFEVSGRVLFTYHYSDGHVESDEMKHTEGQGLNRLYYSPQVSAGVEYAISRHISLQAAPSAKYLMNLSGGDLNGYVFSAGLMLGALYTLK